MTETETPTRKIYVAVEETLRRLVPVEIPDTTDAENMAIAKVSKMYRNEEIVLDADDYIYTSFNIVKIVKDTTKTE